MSKLVLTSPGKTVISPFTKFPLSFLSASNSEKDASVEISIGSSPQCSLRLNGDDEIAQEHSVIELGSPCFISDCETMKGTILNGKKLRPRRFYSLSAGDEITIGSVTFKYEFEQETNFPVPKKFDRYLSGKLISQRFLPHASTNAMNLDSTAFEATLPTDAPDSELRPKRFTDTAAKEVKEMESDFDADATLPFVEDGDELLGEKETSVVDDSMADNANHSTLDAVGFVEKLMRERKEREMKEDEEDEEDEDDGSDDGNHSPVLGVSLSGMFSADGLGRKASTSSSSAPMHDITSSSLESNLDDSVSFEDQLKQNDEKTGNSTVSLPPVAPDLPDFAGTPADALADAPLSDGDDVSAEGRLKRQTLDDDEGKENREGEGEAQELKKQTQQTQQLIPITAEETLNKSVSSGTIPLPSLEEEETQNMMNLKKLKRRVLSGRVKIIASPEEDEDEESSDDETAPKLSSKPVTKTRKTRSLLDAAKESQSLEDQESASAPPKTDVDIVDAKGKEKLTKTTKKRSRNAVPASATKRSKMPVIMFTGIVDKVGETWFKKNGCMITENPMEATHVISDKVRRTVKFLQAINYAPKFVHPTWSTACRSAGMIVDESEYKLVDKAVEKKFKFSFSHAIDNCRDMMKHGRQVFSGLTFVIAPGTLPTKRDLEAILTAGDAKISSSFPSQGSLSGSDEDDEDDRIPSQLKRSFIVIAPLASPRAQKQEWKNKGFKLVTEEFVLSSTLTQELRLRGNEV